MTSPYSAEALFGQQSVPASMGVAAGTQVISAGADDQGSGIGQLINPRNPLVWFGALLLVTVGAAGLAGSVRLGPARVSGSVGKS